MEIIEIAKTLAVLDIELQSLQGRTEESIKLLDQLKASVKESNEIMRAILKQMISPGGN